MPNARQPIRVWVDFDGTVTTRDSTNALLETFADPHWRAIEADWVSGRIGSAECMARQVELLRMSPEQYRQFVDRIEIDPDFSRFLTFCRQWRVLVEIVSDGLDRTIEGVLRRDRLDVTYHANRMVHVGGTRWKLEFPGRIAECGAYCANCKCQYGVGEDRGFDVLIGDGRSDFCIAANSSLVLAKGALAGHCRDNGFEYVAIEGFADVMRQLSALLPLRASPAAAQR